MPLTVMDVITEAMERINILAAGETPTSQDANRALTIFNDLVDSLSNEHLACYQRVENVWTLSGGQAIYTIGNSPTATFLGIPTSGSAILTGVTAIPSDLTVGSYLSGPGIPTGATVTVIGANTITMSANATATFPLEQITYNVPGNIPLQRPLRITNGYSRLTSSGYSYVDYPIDIVSLDQYSSIGLKNQPGPWPKIVYYDGSYPLGTLYFWPVPTQAVELHLWSDVLFSDYASLNTQFSLPQGYERFLKLALARELWTLYRATEAFPEHLNRLYIEAKMAVKNLNAHGQSVAMYDRSIAGKAKNDAGWILHGGFN